MQHQKVGGSLLIASALLFVLVMAIHPTGHQMVAGTDEAHALISVNMHAHAVAIAAAPILFLGLLGLARRLGFTDLTIAALVFHGFGLLAVISAALTSGFVASGVIHEMIGADAAQRDFYSRLLEYTHFFNQAYAGVWVIGSSIGILLWSGAVIRSGKMSKALGWFGVAAGSLILLFMVAGHLRLDVHGFGVIAVAQAIWTTWAGVLLFKAPAPGQPG